MTTLEVARLADARLASKGWVARCKAHADRTPSLSIREGRDGRTLVRCFAGCEPAAIAKALGLQVSDLFADAPQRVRRPSVLPRAPQASEVEASLQHELARIVAEESKVAGFDVATLSRHRNEARSIVERRLSVRLKREPSPWFEVEPHASDPAWLACIDQALRVAAARRGIAVEALRAAIADLPNLHHSVLLYARRLQRSLSKESVSSRPCAA
jgi:hypothetical protein